MKTESKICPSPLIDFKNKKMPIQTNFFQGPKMLTMNNILISLPRQRKRLLTFNSVSDSLARYLEQKTFNLKQIWENFVKPVP
jgi:hypothetical protein